jgi:gliding motility-associated-like protein
MNSERSPLLAAKIKIITLFVFFLAPFIGFAQISTPTWVDDLGGPGSSSSIPASVKVDKQNNVYVVGIYSGTVDFDPSAGVYNLTSVDGSFDTYVAKYTSAGKFIWAVSIGNEGLDQANNLTIDDNGNPTIIGQYDSLVLDADPGPGVFNLQNNGGKDAFIVHLDTNGNFLWAKTVGGGGDDYGDRIVADHLGNVVAVFQYESTVTVGTQTFTSAGATFNGLMVKYDVNGNFIWAVNWSDTGDSEGRSLAIDVNNNVTVTGVFGNSVNFNPLGTSKVLNGNGSASFLAKYASTGSLVWVQQVNGAIINHNLDLCQDASGNIFLDGPFGSALTFNSTNSISPVGTQDVFIAKYNSSGVFQFVKDIGGANSSLYNYGISASLDNNIYISGFFSGTVDFDPSPTSTAPVEDHGDQDLFLAKYDNNLNYKWAFGAGNSSCNNTLGRNLAVDGNNDVILVGSFCSTVNFEGAKCTNAYNLTAQSSTRDSFVAKYVQATATPTSQITAFTVPQQASPAVIDQTHLKITVTVPAKTDVSALKPTITASTGVNLMPASGIAENFTAPVSYTLSTSCTNLNYSVIVVDAVTLKVDTTCSGASNIIRGDNEVGGVQSYTWQVLTNGTWVSAPGVNNSLDYQTSLLLNKTTADITYNVRRLFIPSTQDTAHLYDSFYNVTVVPVVPILNDVITAPAVTAFCISGTPGAITGSIPTGGTGTYTYQWESSADSVTFTNITGANQRDFTPGVLSTTVYYRRMVTSGACNLPVLSNVIKLLVAPAIINNTITAPAVTDFCATGDPAVITGSTPSGGNGKYSFQWQSSADNVTFTDITGAASSTFDPGVISATTYYRRAVSTAVCTTPVLSNVITITVLPAITNNTITAPPVTAFCITGDPGSITGSIPDGGNGTYAYQWKSSTDSLTFSDIPGATQKDFDPGVLSATVYYRRSVTSGICTSPILSNIIKVLIAPPVTNNTITAPAVTGLCANGDPGGITGSTPSGGNGGYSFQWQSSTDNAVFTSIAGATSSTYDPGVISVTTYYRRSVTSAACITPVLSDIVTITVLPAITNNTIGAPPITAYCTSSDGVSIKGDMPSGGSGTYAYQWQSSTDGITYTNVTGADNINFDSSSIITSTTSYRRLVTSGACSVPVPSNAVTITITPTPGIPVPSAATVLVCPGSTATLSVASPQSGITYSWYSSSDEANLLFTGAVYTTSPLSASTTYYIAASNGVCNSISLASVQVNINAVPDAPQLIKSSLTACASSIETINIANPQAGYTYNWYAASTGGSPLFTGVNFITPTLTTTVTYYAEAVNSSGCVSLARAAAVITVNALPLVSAQGTAVCPGTSAALTASSTDPNAVINWYEEATGGSILFTGTNFTTPVLTTAIIYYTEAVDNTTGCASAARTPVPVQITQPLSAPTVSLGEITSSSVTFTWSAITGATGYMVSVDNGATFTAPSSGSDGLTDVVSGLQPEQSVTLVVVANGSQSCQLSGSSTAVTGKTISPLVDNIYVPNAFTPNGDGKNDMVHVHGESIKSLKFYVYDQWGEMLFTSLNPQDGWDGTYKGTREPVGVYVYYLEATMNDGKQVNKKGTITLLR